MDGHSSSGLVAVLLLAALTSSALGQDPLYIKVGNPLVLTPPKHKDVISSIVWTHNSNLVVEWVNKELEVFGSFKGRTELDQSTAQLTVSKTTQSDSGEYKVEINNVPQSQVYKVAVIKKVSKPEVVVNPGCDRTSGECTFICQGDTTGTQPLTYSWKKDSGEWGPEQQSMDLLLINDEDTKLVDKVLCRMKNPISEEESVPFENPSYFPWRSGEVVPITATITSLIIIVGVLVGLGVWKREAIKTKLCAESGPI